MTGKKHTIDAMIQENGIFLLEHFDTIDINNREKYILGSITLCDEQGCSESDIIVCLTALEGLYTLDQKNYETQLWNDF